MIRPGLSNKVASCVMGMMEGDMTQCNKHHGHVYAFERGHKQVRSLPSSSDGSAASTLREVVLADLDCFLLCAGLCVVRRRV